MERNNLQDTAFIPAYSLVPVIAFVPADASRDYLLREASPKRAPVLADLPKPGPSLLELSPDVETVRAMILYNPRSSGEPIESVRRLLAWIYRHMRREDAHALREAGLRAKHGYRMARASLQHAEGEPDRLCWFLVSGSIPPRGKPGHFGDPPLPLQGEINEGLYDLFCGALPAGIDPEIYGEHETIPALDTLRAVAEECHWPILAEMACAAALVGAHLGAGDLVLMDNQLSREARALLRPRFDALTAGVEVVEAGPEQDVPTLAEAQIESDTALWPGAGDS